VWPVAAIFLIVFGGIYGGIFTPTEGAGVGAACTFVAGLAKRELDAKAIRGSFLATAETSGMIFMIFLGADMLNSALALSQMPGQLAQTVSSLGLPPLVVMACVLVFYVLLGCVMDELSMILLTIPVLFPAIMALDLHGLAQNDKAIWFGILVLMVVEIGLIAPPVGLNVYVIHSLAKDVPMAETYRGVVPFLVTDAIRVTLLLVFPILSLWLVKVLT
jgi:TRAP-type C4-dicarboxylate transport system permease large subunit